ncbi:MAG: LysM domain-containing protein [Patescibacteria group bacterium]
MKQVFVFVALFIFSVLGFSQEIFFPLSSIDNGFGLVSEKVPIIYSTNSQKLLAKLGCDDVLKLLSVGQRDTLKTARISKVLTFLVNFDGVVVKINVRMDVIRDNAGKIQARIISVAPPPLEDVDTTIKSPSATSVSDPVVYEVKKGDTLESVAKKYGTSAAILKTLNGIGKKDILQVGRFLVISE